MEILPAIDLKASQVVRLTRGDYAQVKIYSDKPLEIAERWIQAGANTLHLVDLDAALEGKPVNHPIIREIGNLLKKQGKAYEIGGGIRTEAHLAIYLEECLADRVILGTIAYQDPDFVKRACRKYPGKIAVGIDVKDAKIATQGWTKVQNLSAEELAKKFEDAGVSCIVYTDIQRDGMLSGFNFESILDFVSKVSLPVILAGGLKDLNDVQKLREMNPPKILGAITGKAIYEGTLNLKEAIALLSSIA
ncbi:MAG: 1-(5-phosphoribosyl)-5-[(5-phosphoribosylamino)methylideneamino]imidazole-4-carboxamide isomerase [Deltaproteobacteria bacterium]|nr:1-(5-phosphoribosyl)-5-[(5-phosphoribosylamino)methylideneamino]imidazole-4-carboxamide isomerase [Deltaproteobacteria bacterium]